MKNKINQIAFSLIKITTEQFAMLNGEAKKEIINLGSQLRFDLDEKNNILIVFVKFVFQEKDQPFLLIESGCHFKISTDTWSILIKEEKRQICFPKTLISHLVVITIGTTRGVLHTKTENTVFNEFLLPTIDVNELVLKDLKFKLSNLEPTAS